MRHAPSRLPDPTAPQRSEATGARPSEAIRVLLIEDNPGDYVLTRALLNEGGSGRYALDWQQSYEEGLKALSRGNYDICLLDYQLGPADGVALLREAGGSHLRTPVIFLTGMEDPGVDLEALRSGAADYLVKSQLNGPLLDRSIRYAIEHRRTQDALRESEERFRALIENASDIISILDPDGTIRYQSASVTRILGYQPEELIGRNALELVHPEDLSRVATSLHDVARRVRPGRPNLYRVRHKDGSWRVAESMANCRLEDPRVAGVIVNTRDVTERHEAETQLQRVISGARCILWHAEAAEQPSGGYDWNMTVANEEASVELLPVDLQPGESYADAWNRSILPDDLRRLFRESAAAFRSGTSQYRHEFRCRRADGEIRDLSEEIHVEMLEPGRWRLVGVCTDITEHKRAAAALRESERFSRETLDALTGGVAVLDQNGVMVTANKVWRTFAASSGGRTADWWIGANFLDALRRGSQPDHQALADGIQSVMRSKKQQFTLELADHGPGDERWLMARVSRFQGSGPVRVVVSLQNITVRKKAEIESAQLAEILEATPDLVSTAELGGRILYMNRSARELLGLDDEAEVRNRTIPQGHPEWANRIIADEGIPTAIREGFWSGETAVLDANGREIPVSQVILAHRGPDGRVERLSTIARNLSAHKRLEEELRQSQKMEAVGRLAGGVAHDFNNMLGVILGYCDLVMQQPGLPPRARESVSEIKRAGDRAASLTRQLLAFSRKSVLAPQILDVNGLIHNLEKMLRRLIGEDIMLMTLLDPALGQVKADPGQLEQVILNLAINARDAMPAGGRLTLETANVLLDEAYARQHDEVRPGSYVMLSVSDTGIGMDAETRARVFEPFFTTKEIGQGTGLGLSTVYGIIRQSEGHITVTSEPGRGSTFRACLPQVALAQRAVGAASPESWGSGTETILVVEDEPMVRSLVRDVLRMHGYTVLDAAGADEALTLCRSFGRKIDLLLTDVVMPGRSGSELAQHLTGEDPELKVLFMSGYTDDSMLRHGISEYGTAFIQKPFSPAELARKVRDVLSAR